MGPVAIAHWYGYRFRRTHDKKGWEWAGPPDPHRFQGEFSHRNEAATHCVRQARLNEERDAYNAQRHDALRR